jgi:hypothetical protein
MKIDGRCHCGAITFRAEIDPEAVSLCHCTDCQALSGTAFRASVPAPAAAFVLHGDTLTSYIKTAESGRQRRQAFCGTCGSPIYSADVENPHRYTLRIGTISQRRDLVPTHQIWRRSALPWVDGLADIPCSDAE